jgi:Flp pilus assembly CpaF family ATPase
MSVEQERVLRRDERAGEGVGTDVDLEALVSGAQDALAEAVAAAHSRGESFGDDDQHQFALSWVGKALTEISHRRIRDSRSPLSAAERKDLAGAVVRRVFSLLPELEPYLLRQDVTDVYVNGWDDVRAELVDGTYVRGVPFTSSDTQLEEWIQTIARRAGREKAFNPANPRVRTRLPDGSRFTAVSWVSRRPYVAIRCHRHADAGLADLERGRMFGRSVRTLLGAMTRARLNVMIAGDFGVGKTTLMRAMLHEACAPDERIAVLEEEPELQLAEARPDLHDQVLCFETRDANTEGQGTYQFGDLSRTMKWFRPRRIVVGEVQGAEVVDMLEAVTSGRGGGICTIHADSAASVMDRIVMYAGKGGLRWDASYVLRCAAEALKFVVYVDRADDGRRVVSEIRQVVGFDPVQQHVVTNDVFVPGLDGSAKVNPRSQMSAPLQETLKAHGYVPDPPPLNMGAGWP